MADRTARIRDQLDSLPAQMRQDNSSGRQEPSADHRLRNNVSSHRGPLRRGPQASRSCGRDSTRASGHCCRSHHAGRPAQQPAGRLSNPSIEKRSSEVWKILGAVKAQFSTFGEIFAKVQKKLRRATSDIETVGTKTRSM